jgi:hypothetical protein
MRRAMVSGIVALPLAVFAGCFSNGSGDGITDGGGINVNPDSNYPSPDASAVDATYADAAVDSAADAAPPDSSLDASSEAADAADGCEGACAGLYATCAEVRAAMATATDGPYTLYVGHDGSKSWTAYCANLASSPTEYLTLVQTGASSNFSQYTASAATGGTNVITSYTKVRIDPTTLVVDTADQSFSTSTGMLTHPATTPATVTSMPYAEAMDCTGSGSLTGIGNVDLRGTPFTVMPNDFADPGGVSTPGTATYSSGNQVVDLAGGGYCGWEAPVGLGTAPYNMGGGAILNLVYGLGDTDAGSDAGDGGDAADAAD